MGKDFLQGPAMQLLHKSLSTSSLRQKTIANNIANVNTPNYKRQMVRFEEEIQNQLSKPASIPLATTNSNHVSVIQDELSNIKPRIITDKINTLRKDGNNVDIDMELALLSENTVKFNVLSQSLGKKLSLLRSVIRGGR